MDGKVSRLIKAIKYAESEGVQICSLSFSVSDYNEELFQTMKASKMLFVVSAGNHLPFGLDLNECDVYPACFNLQNIIVVTSINQSNQITMFSNYGNRTVNIAAIGEDVKSSVTEDLISGASFAVPKVAASLGIVIAKGDIDSLDDRILQTISYNDSTLSEYLIEGRVLYE